MKEEKRKNQIEAEGMDRVEAVTKIIFDGFEQLNDRIRFLEEHLMYCEVEILSHLKRAPYSAKDLREIIEDFRMEPDAKMLQFLAALSYIAAAPDPRRVKTHKQPKTEIKKNPGGKN